MSELIDALTWYILISAFGLAAAPLAFVWLRHLPDRGWSLSRPLGWVLAGYLVWLLGTLGMARLDGRTGWGVLALVALAAWMVLNCWGGGWKAWRAWLVHHRRLLLVEESLFLLAFAVWVFVRAYDNAILGTEKPMEFAFLNAVVRGGEIPPNDPWLSGYAISYYYFGYLLMGMLSVMGGIPTSIAFNLGVALLFALSALGAFGVGYNLARTVWSSRASVGVGLLAALLLVGVSNLEGALEIASANGLGSPSFYAWLDIRGLSLNPSATWYPSDYWWWWRASRVIHDIDPQGGGRIEMIDEFPFFSFLLGDMHPHVLALPFGLLALAVAFNILRSARRAVPAPAWHGLLLPAEQVGEGVVAYGLTLLVVGALGFLNSWDFPTYGLIVMAAWFVGVWSVQARVPRDMWVALLGIPVWSIALFFPFYVGFRTQAHGLGLVPWAIHTRFHQYLIYVGVVGMTTWAFVLAHGQVCRGYRPTRLALGLAGLAGSVALLGVAKGAPVVVWGVFLAMVALFALDALLARARAGGEAEEARWFVLGIAAVAMLLMVLPEFVFIRDVFGTRMNTVFKFYFQAWTLMAIAGAFGAVWLMRQLSFAGAWVWTVVLAVGLSLSVLYPVAATWTKAGMFRGDATLDGTRWYQASPDYPAAAWLMMNEPAQVVILEGTKPNAAYEFDVARVATLTGLSTVLGWGNHESQWRGNYDEPGRRTPLIERIYTTTDPEEAKRLLDAFNVRYVVVGSFERNTYNLAPPQIEKFATFMTPVFQTEQVLLFAR